MKKIMAWALSALFVVAVIYVVFRLPRVRAFVTGTAPAA